MSNRCLSLPLHCWLDCCFTVVSVVGYQWTGGFTVVSVVGYQWTGGFTVVSVVDYQLTGGFSMWFLVQVNRSTFAPAGTTAPSTSWGGRTARPAGWRSASRREWHWEVRRLLPSSSTTTTTSTPSSTITPHAPPVLLLYIQLTEPLSLSRFLHLHLGHLADGFIQSNKYICQKK